MATANAPASVRKVKALAVPDAEHAQATGLPRATWAFIIGFAVAIVFWIIAALSWEGIFTFVLRPGTTLGLDSAIDYIVFGLIAAMAPYGFIRSRELSRVEKIEERLPDFLRDVAEAGRFGMTLPDAIIVASRGRYGLLTDEIKKMASQLEWGVPVATALRLFEERVPTPLVQRVVSIVTRANEAGGNVADVLTMVAHDTREAQLQVKGREISMLTYLTVIYISFGVFLVTIYIMAAIFLPDMITAGAGVANSSLSGQGGLTLGFTLVPELFLAFFVAVIAHAVGDGVMAGILQKGQIAYGLQHATYMLIGGWLVMRFLVPVLVVPGAS
jgi:flagellar protein FlaJ